MTTKSGGAITIPSMDPATIGTVTPNQALAAAHMIARHARDDADRALLLNMCGLTTTSDSTPGGTT